MVSLCAGYRCQSVCKPVPTKSSERDKALMLEFQPEWRFPWTVSKEKPGSFGRGGQVRGCQSQDSQSESECHQNLAFELHLVVQSA